MNKRCFLIVFLGLLNNTLELFIKKTVGKIVTNAIKSAIENEKVNANRKSDSEVAFIK